MDAYVTDHAGALYFRIFLYLIYTALKFVVYNPRKLNIKSAEGVKESDPNPSYQDKPDPDPYF